jgi:hypothetical protein
MENTRQKITVKKGSKKRESEAKRDSKHLCQKKLQDKKKAFLHYFSNLPIQKLAADYIGVSEDTITDWKKRDKQFSDQIALAKSEWALEKAGKVKSVEWLLERVMKDHFVARTETEHSVNEELEKAIDRIAKALP